MDVRVTVVMLLALLLLSRCAGKVDNKVADLIETKNKKIAQAILLRNNGQYKEALKLFQSIQSEEIPETEREYCRQNTALCTVLNEESFLNRTDSNIKDIISGLTAVIIDLRNQVPQFELLYPIKNSLLLRNRPASFFNLLTYEYLGLTHQLTNQHVDSALYYYKEAREIIAQNHALANHTPRILYHLAGMTLINRDQISGLAYVDEALSYKIDDCLKAKLLIIQGTLFRKLSRFNASDSSYQLAAKSISDADTALRLLLLREQALHSIIVKDTLRFFAQIKTMHSIAEGVPDREAEESRLWGYYYLNKGRTQESITHYAKSLEQFQKQKYPETVLLMEALYILTQQHQSLKQYYQAEEAAYQALVALTDLQGKPYTWENTLHPAVMNRLYSFINYDLLANVYLSRYKDSDLKDGSQLLKTVRLYEVIDSLMWFQVRVAEENAMLRFLEVGDKIYSGAVETCYLAFKQFGDVAYMEKAHHYMERDKALILYGDILMHDENYFPDVPAEFKKSELEIKRRIAGAKNEGFSENGKLSKAINALDKHYDQMKTKYPSYYAAKFQKNIPGFNFYKEKSNTENKSIIQYLVGAENIYLLNYTAPGQFIQIPGAKKLQDEIFSMRKLISAPMVLGDTSAISGFFQLSTALYHQLISPLVGLKKNLLIVPHGPLNDLPFEILCSKESNTFVEGNFLVRQHDIAYTASLKTFQFDNGNQKKGVRSALAFAYSDPDDTGLKTQWPFIKGSITELQQISSYFGEHATLRFGLKASRKFFLNEIEKPYDVIHVALHAASSHTDRLGNKIYFPSESGKDEIVYGYELVPKNCEASLVMITGCESGFGPTAKGEGTYSLTRAFLQGGAKSVAGSLWSLPDFSSARLTGAFYQSLKLGSTPSGALGQAKRDYLKTADNNTAHPFYWAGLVVYGN